MGIDNKLFDKQNKYDGEEKRQFIEDVSQYIDEYDYKPSKSTDEGIPILPTSLAKLIEPDLSDNCKLFSELIRFNAAASPRSLHIYHYGAILNLLAALSAGRLKILKGQQGIRTDFYIMHYGHSSVWAKSQALVPSKQILEALNLSFLILPSRVTVSKLFSLMSARKETDADMPDEEESPENYQEQLKINKFAGQRSFIFDELGKVLRGLTNERGITYEWGQLLLEFADNNKRMTYATMKDDSRTIIEPFLTLVGNATPPNFLNLAEEKIASLKGDGLFPRFLVASPSDTDIPKWAMSSEPIPIPDFIIAHLFRWHQILGEPDKVMGRQPPVKQTLLTLDEDTEAIHNAYDKWLFESKVKEFKEWKAAYTRHANKVLKIAGLMASLNGKTEITKNEYVYALQIGEMYRGGLHDFYDSINNPETTNKYKDREDAILAKLQLWGERGKLPVARSVLADKLSKKLFRSLAKSEIYGIFDDLRIAGLIYYHTPKSISLYPKEG